MYFLILAWALTSVIDCISYVHNLPHVNIVTRDGRHMFPYGPEAGDEQILVDDLPSKRNTHGRPMFGRGVPFDHIKLFRNGHAELHSNGVNTATTPYIGPYYLPYSEVASGHIWYRETQDQESLDEVTMEIQKAFPDDGFTADPDSMIVITWQFNNITVRYPQCDSPYMLYPYQKRGGWDICECLRTGWYAHYTCECTLLYNVSHDKCDKITMGGDFRYSSCTRRSRPLNWYDLWAACACVARHQPGARYCAARSRLSELAIFNIIELCDICSCGMSGRCFCDLVGKYVNHGKLKCFLLFALEDDHCLTLSWYYGYGYHRCKWTYRCRNPGTTPDPTCNCLLPDSLTEPHLMGCLLKYNYHGDMWICDDPDLDLDYCKCISDRTSGDYMDDIYCKCDVYSKGNNAALCHCLQRNGYNRTMPDCSRKRRVDGCYEEMAIPNWRRPTESNLAHKSINTFQAVIVYNEWQTFIYYNYQKLAYSDFYIEIRIGHVVGANATFEGYIHPYSHEPYYYHTFLFHSNTDMDGRWLYKVGRNITPANRTSQVHPSP